MFALFLKIKLIKIEQLPDSIDHKIVEPRKVLYCYDFAQVGLAYELDISLRKFKAEQSWSQFILLAVIILEQAVKQSFHRCREEEVRILLFDCDKVEQELLNDLKE